MIKLNIQKYWHKLFELGIFLKSINGVWETISGVLVLTLSRATLNSWFLSVAHKELLEDPNDMLVGFLTRSFKAPSGDTKTFIAAYILFHGLLNLFLAIQLYRDKHWAYLVSIVMSLAFISYQIHRIVAYRSLVLIAFTIFDIIFIILSWHEYKHHKKSILA